MDKKEAFPNIDFADSDFNSFKFLNTEGKLIVHITSWDNRKLIITFSEVISILYRSVDLMSNVYEIIENTPLLEEAVELLNKKTIESNSYKLFQIEDIYDEPIIQVVAKSTEIIKE